MNRVPLLPGEEIIYRSWLHPVVFSRAVWSLLVGWAVWYYAPQIPQRFEWAASIHYEIVSAFPWFTYTDTVIAVILVLDSVRRLVESIFIYRSTEIVVSNRRILVRFGIWSTTQTELESRRIAGVLVHQSPLGRLLDYGWVRVQGFSGDLIMIPLMMHPHKVQQAISTATSLILANASADPAE